MDITRKDIVDAKPGWPIFSRVVIHGDRVYLCGVVPDPGGDVRSQTRHRSARAWAPRSTTRGCSSRSW